MKTLTSILVLIFLFFASVSSYAQLRNVYTDATEDNEIFKISFYSPNEGYVAFRDWIGYTSDSGHTFIHKEITLANVDFNGYLSANLSFGFSINGVKAFDQNTLIVYGHYALVPAILYSVNGGNSFKLIFYDQYDPMVLSGGITDMIFPQNNSTGYAVDADRILKTTDKGLNWSVVKTLPGSCFSYLEAFDNNNVIAFSSGILLNMLVKTTDGGNNWQTLSVPQLQYGTLFYASFLNNSTGWISMSGGNGEGYFYKTTNGGSTWLLQNNPFAASFTGTKIKFIDANTAYAVSDLFTVFKTTDGGAIWEPLKRDNKFTYLGYTHNDLQFFSGNQFWAGGGHGFLELTSNAGGTPLPKAYFLIDSAGYSATGKVSLMNYSKSNYSFQWFVNGSLVSTGYNAQYTHDVGSLYDTVRLIVSNGSVKDTSVHYQSFYPPLSITSFSPVIGAAGTQVTITGANLYGVKAVYFGNTPAAGFTYLSSTSVKATVGKGATGSVTVVTERGTVSLPGFTFVPPPAIMGFSPASCTAGTTVTILGSNFLNATAVSFGGIPAASFTVIADNQINAVVPSGNDGPVSVTTPGGTASLAGFVSVPTINSFTPLKGTQGTVMQINGTSLTGTTSVTVAGIPVLSYTVNSSKNITAIVSTGASGDVLVTKPGGSSSKGTFTWFPPPVITSFAPQSGTVGTSITINGTGFNEGATSNVVYIGGVKAIINNATTTSINITVPLGTISNYITVNSNNLIGYSPKPFTVSFENGGTINAAAFIADTVINSTTNNSPAAVTSADLDGDGKTDLIVSKYGSLNNGVLVYRNITSGVKPLFDNPVDLPADEYADVFVADIDGDGKLDIITKSNVLLNKSVPGNISFINNYTFTNPNAVEGIAVKDVDGDGKPDIVYGSYPANVAIVYRNISEPGAASFAPAVNYPASGYTILLEDLDNDGKPDLIIPNGVERSFIVMKNNSAKGKIVFDNAQTFQGYTHAFCSTADFDGDGRSDLVFAGNDAFKAAVLRNTTSGGVIQFDTVRLFDATSRPAGIITEDFDGDGKPDIALNLYDYNLQLLKNTSTNANISFAQPIRLTPGIITGYHNLCAGDFNNDGKPDIATISETKHIITVYTNYSKPAPFILSFTPVIGKSGTVVTITGNNFTNVSQVSFGGVPAASFTVNSPTQITATVGNGASGVLAVTNNEGTSVIKNFVFANPPLITDISPSSGPVGTSVTITGKNFSTIASKNIVTIGGTRVPVTNVTSTTLNISIPSGISFDDIIVTVDSFSARSTKRFNLTFPGAQSAFNASSFNLPYLRNQGSFGTLNDVDGDGKTDLVLTYLGNLAIARNTSIPGVISFANNAITSSVFIGSKPETDDIDGDGKSDIIFYNSNNRKISVFHNSSTPGNIIIDPPVTFDFDLVISNPLDLKIRDIDLDGKPDIAILAYNSSSVTIYRNTSFNGIISFEPPLCYQLYSYGIKFDIKDLDGDNKPEIFATSSLISIFKNISIPGSINFANRIELPAGTNPYGLVSADMDSDGKQDIVVSNALSDDLSVYPNNCTNGTISFGARSSSAATHLAYTVGVGDWDGDGKPDVCVSNIINPSYISLYKNTSTPGNISLLSKFDILAAEASTTANVLACDIDLDGYTDLVAFLGNSTTAVYRNKLSNIITAVGNVSASGYDINYFPNPVTSILNINNLQLSHKWETLSVISFEGKKLISTKTIQGKTSFTVNLSSLKPGLYLVELENTAHKKLYFNILKS